MAFNALAQSDPPALSLVMPVRGEGCRIIPAVMTLAFTVTVPLEILILHDREDDPTLKVVRELQSHFPGVRLARNTRQGVIGAIRTGFDTASADVVGIWVSYHVDPFGLVNQMYRHIEAGCDLVSGNRFNRIKRVSRGSVLKKLLSRLGNYALNRLIGIPIGDITTSLKLYRKGFLRNTPIETTTSGGWALSAELAVKAAIQGVKMAEVEFLPENVNLIHGVTNFRVFGQLDQYLKWLWIGVRNRQIIRSNYRCTAPPEKTAPGLSSAGLGCGWPQQDPPGEPKDKRDPEKGIDANQGEKQCR